MVRELLGFSRSFLTITISNVWLFGFFSFLLTHLQSFEMTTKLTAHRGAIYCISVVGTFLFSGSYDNTIRVWDLRWVFVALSEALLTVAGYGFVSCFRAFSDADFKTMECVQVLK